MDADVIAREAVHHLGESATHPIEPPCYGGANHPHDGQQPKSLDVAALNPKNKRG